MLVLTRRLGEGVRLRVCGANPGIAIHVRVTWLGPDKCRLAFEAPPQVVILRDELLEHGEDVKAGRRSSKGKGAERR